MTRHQKGLDREKKRHACLSPFITHPHTHAHITSIESYTITDARQGPCEHFQHMEREIHGKGNGNAKLGII